MEVSSVHLPAGSEKGPPPTMSVSGAKLPRGWNSSVVPTASPQARPSRAPRYRSSVSMAMPVLALMVGQERCCAARSEEHTSELQSQSNLVCRLLLEKNNHQ